VSSPSATRAPRRATPAPVASAEQWHDDFADTARRVPARVNIRRELEILSRSQATIPYSQFLQLCRDRGLPTDADAHALAADLTVCGVAAHFPEERHGADVASIMFLRPAEILRELDAATGRAKPDAAAQAEQPRAAIERVRARRAALAHAIAPLTAQLLTWESEATKAANRRLLAGLGGYFGVQVTFLLYTFELVDDSAGWPMVEDVLQPGWDVMEPLTYTVGSGFAWLSCVVQPSDCSPALAAWPLLSRVGGDDTCGAMPDSMPICLSHIPTCRVSGSDGSPFQSQVLGIRPFAHAT
jgi:hypothetical protein